MSTNAGGHDIDIGSLWGGVRKALPALLGLMLLAGVATFGILSMMAPRFEAETQLTITAKPASPYGSGKNDSGAAATVTPRLDPAAINTHVRALMAPDLLIKVGRDLGLAGRAEFNRAVGPVDSLDTVRRSLGLGGFDRDEGAENRMLEAMQKNLSVFAARESRFITIRFRSTDPEVAADVANGIARNYRESLREIPVRETNEAVSALLPKIEQLNREVFEAEAVAKRFRAETDQLTGGARALTLEQQRLERLSADLVKAEAAQSQAESRLGAAREIPLRGGADTLPEVQNSRVIQDLIAQRVRVERQVNEARAVLLPGHPRMRQLTADLAGLRRSIEQEIGVIIDSISKEARVNQLRADQLRGEIAALKKASVARSGDEAKLRSLEATATSKRNELERLQKQLEDNRTVVDTNRVPVESTIVSAARPDRESVFPKKGAFTLLAMAAALMTGLFFVIGRGLMFMTQPKPRRAPAAPEPRAAPPVLSGPLRVRDPAATGNSTGRVIGAAPVASGSSPMAPFAKRFFASKSSEGGFRLLVAGRTNNIDPSDEAAELAVELSEAGARVLLVDWALDGRQLLRDVARGRAAGLAELINGDAQFEDVLISLADSNVQYAYASRSAGQPQLSDEAGLNLVLDAFDEAYDHVIVFGRHDDARALFETIEGRFDAGLIVAEGTVGTLDKPHQFLGFDVTDIDIQQHIRPGNSPSARERRLTPA